MKEVVQLIHVSSMMNAGDKFIVSFVKYSIEEEKNQLNGVTKVIYTV